MRAQLINDIFSFSRMGLVKADLLLDLIGYLQNELEYLPWSVFLNVNNARHIVDLLSTTNLHSHSKDYFSKLIQPIYTSLTWIEKTDEDWLNKYKT